MNFWLKKIIKKKIKSNQNMDHSKIDFNMMLKEREEFFKLLQFKHLMKKYRTKKIIEEHTLAKNIHEHIEGFIGNEAKRDSVKISQKMRWAQKDKLNDYKKMSVAQLKKYCRDKKYRGFSKCFDKHDLIIFCERLNKKNGIRFKFTKPTIQKKDELIKYLQNKITKEREEHSKEIKTLRENNLIYTNNIIEMHSKEIKKLKEFIKNNCYTTPPSNNKWQIL